MRDLKNFICQDNASITEAFRLLNKSGKGILFVVDESQQFVGTLTDGDIRRAILRNKNINLKVFELVYRDALFAEMDESPKSIIKKIHKTQKLRKTKEKISIVPLLKEGKVIDFFEFKSRFYAPIASPVLNGDEMLNLCECVITNWISSQGAFIKKFEADFADKFGIKFAVTTMNGTTALHLALASLGISHGDEVIVPSLTFAATINSVIYTGATPVIVDIRRDSWCIDPELVEKNITKKTKAVIPVHIYGQACNMKDIMSIAKNYDMKVIEDCAEAIGARYENQFVGTFGDIGCFSFYGNKIITTGEGGMCITDCSEFYNKMRLLRDHGKDSNKRDYYHTEIGFNYRMTNLQAAIGVAQLEKINYILKKRQEIEKTYQRELGNFSSFEAQKELPGREKVCWLVSFLFEHKNTTRDDLIKDLKKEGVDARPFFVPMHEMEIYKKYVRNECPVSSEISEKGIQFPTSLIYDKDKVQEIISIIKSILK